MPVVETNTANIPIQDNIAVTVGENLYIFKTLNPNKSCKEDKLPKRNVKIASVLISDSLSQLINKSFRTGIFPYSWKEPTVHPHVH